MTSVSKKLYINKLVNIVNDYNNTYHSAIKVKLGNIKPNAQHTDIAVANNDKYPKFEVGNYVRISKYKNTFAKRYAPNWSKAFLRLKYLKILSRRHIQHNTFVKKKLLGRLIKKELQKRKQRLQWETLSLKTSKQQ